MQASFSSRYRPVLVLFAVALVSSTAIQAAALPSPQSADEGETRFGQKCAACHTIGRGPRVGPDLLGVTAQRDREWLARWLAEPDRMLAEGDPIALQLLAEYNNVPMPNLGLTKQEVQALVAYLESRSTAGGETPAPPLPPAELPTGNPPQGRALFTGRAELANGGPGCMSCHSIAGIDWPGGGMLGPDLTPAFAKYGGDAGVAAVLADPPFPTMKPIYDNRPLTAEEQANLRAFLEAAAQEQPLAADWPLVGLAGGGFVALMTSVHLIWRRRLQGVRRSLVEKKRMAP